MFLRVEMDTDHRFTLANLLVFGDQDPEKNAIESPGCHPLTYREFREMIRSAVRMLNNLGFCRNDRLAIISPAGPETAVCIIAVMAGFTAVPLNPQFTGREFSEIFNRLRIKAIIIQRDLATTARSVARERKIPVIDLVPVTDTAGLFTLLPEAPQECDNPEFAVPSDTACILLTSGTTAESKVIPVSQKQISLSRTRSGFFQGLTPDDRCLHIIPYYHGMGIGAALLSPLIAGGTVICTRNFIPGDFYSLVMTCPAYPLCCRACGPAGHSPGIKKAASRGTQGAFPEVHPIGFWISSSGYSHGTRIGPECSGGRSLRHVRNRNGRHQYSPEKRDRSESPSSNHSG